MQLRVNAAIRLDHHENGVEPRRAFEMAARWQPDLTEPVTTHAGRDARSIIRNLGDGEEVPVAQLGLALIWLDRAHAYYLSTEPPMEAYRSTWQEAAADMTEARRWLDSIHRATLGIPTSLTAPDPTS